MTMLFFLKPHYRPRVGPWVIKRGQGDKKRKKVYHVSEADGLAVAKPVQDYDWRHLIEEERTRDRTRKRKKVERMLIYKLRTEDLI